MNKKSYITFSKIKIKLNNLYLFKNQNDEYLLLDTGINITQSKIIKKLNDKIGDFNKIKVIVISHSHADHIGNLKELIDRLGDRVKVISHIKSKQNLLSGRKEIPNGVYKITKKISKKLKEKAKKNIKEDFPKLNENDLQKINFIDFKEYNEFNLEKYGFQNLKIIYTPGHSKDLVSLILKENDKKYIFCTDLVQNILFKKPLIPLFADNIEELLESWKKVIDCNYDKIYPAMGQYVLKEDMEREMNRYEKNRI